MTASQEGYAQEKSKYEKRQEKKIRKYRKRIKTRKADKPYQGNASGYSKSRRIKNTPTVYAQPDPYAFRSRRYRQRKIYSNDALRLASPTSDKPYSGKIQPIRRNRNRSRGKINAYPQINPYKFRKLRSEGERISDRQESFGTDPRDPERPAKRRRIRTQSASGRFVINRKAKPYKLKDRKKWEETYTGDAYGRRSGIEPRNTQKVSTLVSPNPYSKRGRLGDKPYQGAITGGAKYNTATKRGERAWKGDIAGKKLRNNRSRGGNFNIYPQASPYANRKMRSERQRMSGDQESYGTDPRNPQRASKRGRIKIRSASGRYTVNKKAKPYKLKDVKKWEETYIGDFYGRRSGIEPRNTQRISTLISPNPYEDRGRMGDKPYRGNITGGFSSATKKGERAWQGDIAGRRIDHSKPRSTQRSGGRARRIPTASGGLHNNRGRAINSQPPSAIAEREQKFQGHFKRFELEPGFESGNINYQGNIKGQRALKGGGSISNRMNRNNSGRAILSFRPGNDALRSTKYTGEIHAEEIYFKFGSGHLQYEGDIPKEELSMGFSGAHLNYSGDIKARRPLKGGGSLARNNWNNRGRALSQKPTPSSSAGFSGNIRGGRPLKGGGSKARNDWNNREQALPKKYGDNTRTPAIFSGNIKTEARSGGGGSISTNGWTNKGRALPRKNSGSGVAGNFSGNMRSSGPEKRSRGSATRTGSWNNEGSSTNNKSITPMAYYMTRHTGETKQKTKYRRNKAADDNALRVREPNKAYFQAGNFQGNMKQSRRKIDGTKHTSTKFYNSKKEDNAVEEKKKFISFKLLWNKLFNKSDPSKDKEKKPRYDKNEKGLWYE